MISILLNLGLLLNSQLINYNALNITEKLHQHHWVDWQWMPSTCETDGYNLQICECGYEEKFNIVPSPGHTCWNKTIQPTCSEEGSLQKVCYRCNKVVEEINIPKSEHKNVKWTVKIKAGSLEKDGFKIGKCIDCGKKVEQPYTYTERTKEEKNSRNIYARLSIPDIYIDVALFLSASPTIVDNMDSAACFCKQGVQLIADHSSQAFSAMKNCTVGTSCYIVDGYSIKKYLCTAVENGYNNRHTLLKEDQTTSALSGNEGKLMMYTCRNTTGWPIIYTVWDLVETITN